MSIKAVILCQVEHSEFANVIEQFKKTNEENEKADES